jgi:hypothetical protein
MDKINIEELIKDMREVLFIENKVEKIEAFLNLLPENEILKLMIEHQEIKEEDVKELKILILNILPDMEEYKFFIEAEKNKTNQVNAYLSY